jgi:hypothetical protein
MRHARQATDSIPPNGRGHNDSADQLVVLDHAFRELASCNSLEQIKDIRDKAETVRQYVRSARVGLALQNKAAEVKLRAERRAGELLRAMRLRGGDRVSESAGLRTTLKQLDINESQSARWQKLATIPEPDFGELLASRRDNTELTTAYFLRIATSREKKCAAPREFPTGQMTEQPGRQPSTRSPDEIIRELLDHCHALDNVLSTLDDGDGPIELAAAERRYVRRLVQNVESLLTDLRDQTVRTLAIRLA